MIEKSDLDETDHVKARRTRRQPKPRSIGGNRRVEGHQYRDNDEVEKGLKSRCIGVKEHLTRGVEERGTGQEKEREQGVKTQGGAGSKNRWMLTQGADLKLTLRGSVDRASPTWAGSAEEAESRIRWRPIDEA